MYCIMGEWEQANSMHANLLYREQLYNLCSCPSACHSTIMRAGFWMRMLRKFGSRLFRNITVCESACRDIRIIGPFRRLTNYFYTHVCICEESSIAERAGRMSPYRND